MAPDPSGATGIREIITSDATVLAGLLLVGAAAFDLVWLLITAVAIPGFPKVVAVVVAGAVFLGSILAQVIVARRAGLSFDDETVWWRTGLGRLHHVPTERVRFGVRHRFGVAQATIADGDGAPVVVPRLAVVTWTNPDATLAVRELDPDSGKPGPWVDLGQRWKDVHQHVLEQTLDDREAFTYALANAPKD